jgi:hypothetical protein
VDSQLLIDEKVIRMMTRLTGRTMADIVALHASGCPDLALLVLVSNGRPIVNWPGMAQTPSLDNARVAHAALRGAYQACAPGEIGEAAGQFTHDAEQ